MTCHLILYEQSSLHCCRINTIGDFFPQTYRLDSTAECEEYFKNFKGNIIVDISIVVVMVTAEGEVWICKPNAANQVTMVAKVTAQIYNIGA